MNCTHVSILAFVCGTVAATECRGQLISQAHKLYHSDIDSQDYLGSSVNIDGTRVIIGAMNYDIEDDMIPPDGEDEYRIGGCWIFSLTDGSEVVQLVRSDPNSHPSNTEGDLFGYISDLSGDIAVVGSPHDDSAPGASGPSCNSGAAYLFDATDGDQIAKLVADDDDCGDAFGKYVAIDGDIVVVSSIHDSDTGSSNIGSVYLFEAETGDQLTITNLTSGTFSTLTNKFRSSDGGAGKNFGRDVAIDGNYILVTSGEQQSDDGKVYLYEISDIDLVNDTVDIEEIAVLDDPITSTDTLFGRHADLDGTLVIVGDPGMDDFSSTDEHGRAYIFDGSTETRLHTLIPPDSHDEDWFGYSVAIDGDYAVVGAVNNTGNGVSNGVAAGVAYVYDVNTGDLVCRFVSDDIAGGDAFGRSVDINGMNITVGAVLETVGGTQSGSAYHFELDFDSPFEDTKVDASDGDLNDLFGSSISTNGDDVYVGAPGSSFNSGPGAVYVFDASTLSQVDKLTPTGGTSTDNFGYSVAANSSGELVVIGAPDLYGTGVGEVFVFDAVTGDELAVLTASDGSSGDYFGHSVAIVGMTVLVGAPGDDDEGNGSGSAYLYDISGLLLTTPTSPVELDKFTASDGGAGDEFGFSVAMVDQFNLFIGAPSDDDEGTNAGAMYEFVGSGFPTVTYSEGDKFSPTALSANDGFGSSLAADSLRVVVGAPGDTNGMAFMYDSGDLSADPIKLFAPDGASGDAFGSSVAILDHDVVVGAPFDDDATLGTDAGSAYIFDTNCGYFYGKLLASDGAASDRFGSAVAVSDGWVYPGSPLDDDNGASSGSAYFFEK